MIAIEDRITSFLTQERPAGVMLEPAQVIGQAVAATVLYRGLALLDEHRTRLDADPLAEPLAELDAATPLTDSEWALIRPLFLLYLERETCLLLEASRGLGVDVFGRSSSEIAGDIAMTETELAHRAFMVPIVSVI